MAFFAIDKKTQQKVDIRRAPTVYKTGEVECVLCNEDLIVKYGYIVTSHFAHFPGSKCSLASGETPAHILGKEYLAKLLSVESNVIIEQSLGFSQPRPDILADYNKVKIAHEIQLSYIQSFNLQLRMTKLKACGVGQNWWLGGKALTPWNKKVTQSHVGFASMLQITDEFDLPLPVVEKIIYDGDIPYIVRSDYPIIKPEVLQTANLYKFVGTNGYFNLWKILDVDGKLVQLQNFFNEEQSMWTYLNPKIGQSIWGKAIQATIYDISRDHTGEIAEAIGGGDGSTPSAS